MPILVRMIRAKADLETVDSLSNAFSRGGQPDLSLSVYQCENEPAAEQAYLEHIGSFSGPFGPKYYLDLQPAVQAFGGQITVKPSRGATLFYDTNQDLHQEIVIPEDIFEDFVQHVFKNIAVLTKSVDQASAKQYVQSKYAQESHEWLAFFERRKNFQTWKTWAKI